MSFIPNPPLVSIVTPCFNAAAFLEQTIVSVLDQSYHNIEYIIVDGGSTDGSVEIIKRYDKYLTYWLSEPDSGQAHAIKKGLMLSRGQVFNWLNADDTYTPGALAVVADAFQDSSVNVFAAKSKVYGLGRSYISSGTDVYSNNLERTIGRARIDQPETFFRRSVIDKLGGINCNLHYLMDLELWIRYLLYYGLTGIVKSDDILVNFRLHTDSKTVSQQDGFAREGHLLASIILDSVTSEQCPALIEALAHNPLNIDLKLARREFAFFRFSTAYAQRDWDSMKAWKKSLLAMPFSTTFLPEILQLELRRILLHLLA